MKAVIMAGGEGSRLRPLTCDLPKPMARLCGRPILEYILELLAKHGVTKASLTLRYLPHLIIEHFPDGAFAGIELEFIEETQPLGTAGSVKNACGAEKDRDETILVISGDAMCDFDLTSFAAEHARGGAAVTILGKRVNDPREFGLIDMDVTGRVAGFIEKPAFSQAVSDIANTGIYLLDRRVLERVPDGVPFDFARDLFPLLLSEGEQLQCWEDSGYWCDIGDLDTYLSCQRDMLLGRVKCSFAQSDIDDGRSGAQAAGPMNVRIVQPVYIGKNVTLGDDALIEMGSVLDDGCTVGAGARVSGSVLLPGAHVGRRARLTGALLCAGASVKAGGMLFEGSAVGAGAVVGEQATIAAGIKIWNGKRVPDFARVRRHLKTGEAERELFGDDGMQGQIGVELTPEFAARFGAAVGTLNAGARVAVGCGPGRASEMLRAALVSGIQSTGAHVVDFGTGFAALFEFSMNFCAVEAGVFVRGDNHASLSVMSGGLPATRQTERGIEGMLARGEFARAAHDGVGETAVMAGVNALYLSQLLRLAPGGLAGMAAQARSKNPIVQSTLQDALERLGCEKGDMSIEVSNQGDRLRIYDAEAGTVRGHTILTVCAAGELARGQDVALPFDAPRIVDEIAASHGRRVLRYLSTPADDSDHDARKLARSQLWSRDALMQAVMFLELARRAGSVKRLLEQYRDFDVAVRTLETLTSPAALIRSVSDHKPGAVGEGVLLEDERGTVLLKPLKRGNGLRILAEAHSSETARELCDSMEELLRKMSNETQGGESG